MRIVGIVLEHGMETCIVTTSTVWRRWFQPFILSGVERAKAWSSNRVLQFFLEPRTVATKRGSEAGSKERLGEPITAMGKLKEITIRSNPGIWARRKLLAVGNVDSVYIHLISPTIEYRNESNTIRYRVVRRTYINI